MGMIGLSVQVVSLGDDGRYAIMVDGLARFVGTREKCVERARLLYGTDTSIENQNQALGRAVRRII